LILYLESSSNKNVLVNEDTNSNIANYYNSKLYIGMLISEDTYEKIMERLSHKCSHNNIIVKKCTIIVCK